MTGMPGIMIDGDAQTNNNRHIANIGIFRTLLGTGGGIKMCDIFLQIILKFTVLGSVYINHFTPPSSSPLYAPDCKYIHTNIRKKMGRVDADRH